MAPMDVHGYMKRAFEETLGPETRAPSDATQRSQERITALESKLAGLQAKIEVRDVDVSGVRAEMMSLKNELLAEVRRLDARIDSLDRELRTAINVRERLAALEARPRA